MASTEIVKSLCKLRVSLPNQIGTVSKSLSPEPPELEFQAISRRATLYEMIRDYGQAIADLHKLVSLLTEEVDKKTNPSGKSDKVDAVNELRQTSLKLSEMEEATINEILVNMYLILGVDPSAPASEIKKAYRKAILNYNSP